MSFMATQGRQARVKGGQYERQIAKKLSSMFKVNVSRSAYSGAKRGLETDFNTGQSNDYGFVGDLYFPKDHPMSIFNYELKNHDSVKFSQFFYNNGEIPSFLEQVTTDSERLGGIYHSVPCLIIHIKRQDDYVVIPYEVHTYAELVKNSPVMVTLLSYQNERTQQLNRYQMLVTTLKAFGQLNPQTMYDRYHHLDWNKLNHFETKRTTINIDKLLKGIGDKDNAVT